MIKKKYDQSESPVEEYYLGNTKIKIFDTYCVKTKEEIDSILERVKEITINSIRAREYQQNIFRKDG